MADILGTVGIYTLGCKVNQYESEAIAERCKKLGISVLPAESLCDAYIINTCTVTAEADRKARQFIRRAKAQNPDAFISVTGCFAQVSSESIVKLGITDYICGNSRKLSTADATARLLKNKVHPAMPQINIDEIDSSPFENMSIQRFARTRACIKIEDGCESHCTYCIIPSARGKIRSKSPSDVINEVRRLTENGCKEVVLTGIETAAYGKDLENTNLYTVLSEIDKIDGIGRVRLGSMDPSIFKPDFINKIASLHSLTPHFHLSVQSGSDSVLAGMKRKYNSEMLLTAMENLRHAIPGVQFTSDIIVGFPGETDENFEETMHFAEQAQFLSIHVFTYSRRKGTPAAAMKNQIPQSVKHARSASLINKQKLIRKNILENVIAINPYTDILAETYDGKYVYGHTASFIEVRVPMANPPLKEFIPVRLCSTDGEICTAQFNE